MHFNNPKRLIAGLTSLALITTLIAFAPNQSQAKSAIENSTQSVKISSGTKKVNTIQVNLNNPKLKIDVIAAGGRVGDVKPLSSIAKSAETKDSTVVAAINGTFFDAYTKTGPKQPWGTIIKNGKPLHLGVQYATVGFTKDSKVKFDRMKIQINGKIVGKDSEGNPYENSWYAWNINHVDPRDEAIVILTPEFGKTTGPHKKQSVVVTNGVVTAIKTGDVPIPANGYVVVTLDKPVLERFTIGCEATYEAVRNTLAFKKDAYFETDLAWAPVENAVSAGPTLIKDGALITDYAGDGFGDSKIVTKKAQRSFIGVKKDNTLIMGTVSSVTVKELGEITKQLGLHNAINLDGGASSGLYYNGKYVWEPGREISNALVFSLKK